MSGRRTVSARWDGGLRAVVDAGGFELIVDEPPSVGGDGRGPQPTDLLLASVSSCFAIALAYAGRKKAVDLPDLVVDATGTYDGPRFRAIAVSVRSSAPTDVLAELLPEARRVCYVTNTLGTPPEITFGVGSGAETPRPDTHRPAGHT